MATSILSLIKNWAIGADARNFSHFKFSNQSKCGGGPAPGGAGCRILIDFKIWNRRTANIKFLILMKVSCVGVWAHLCKILVTKTK